MKYCRIKLPAGSTDYTIFFPGKAASRKSAICIGALYLHRNILLQSGFETVLLDMLTEFDALRTERIGRTTWLVGRMGGPLDGGRGEYGCWYNLETRGADILYAEFTVESYMGGSLCTGTWASEDCLIYGLTEETQTEGESVAVTSQITIEGIRGLYTAKDIQRESVFEKTLRREYVYDASRGCLVIAGAQ